MSRYSKYATDPETGKSYAQYVWGFDPPLTEYFIHCLRPPSHEDYDIDELEWGISSYFTLKPHPRFPQKMQYANFEIMDIMKEIGADADHIAMVGADLPF